MVRRALEFRAALNLVVAAVFGVVGLRFWPFAVDNAFLAVIDVRKPWWLFDGLAYLYATLWFTTPLIGLTVITALLRRRDARGRTAGVRAITALPESLDTAEPFLVLGEQHHPTQPTRVAAPTWLTIPHRALHTGVMTLGAGGTGKTSACMYPYVDQLLAWRATSPDKKIGGLVLEVKGDFCAQVRRIFNEHGRADDYFEIGLDSSRRSSRASSRSPRIPSRPT